MRNEITSKRLSAFSSLQRKIVSPRCKAVDIDWRVYCDVCGRAYLFIEETETDVGEKIPAQTKRHAAECKPPAKAVVLQFTDAGFRVKDLDTNLVTIHSPESLADLVMHYRDGHDVDCPLPRGVTWDEEKARNGGSPWRS